LHEILDRKGQFYIHFPTTQVDDRRIQTKNAVADNDGDVQFETNGRNRVVAKAAEVEASLVVGQLKVEALLRQPVFWLAQLVHQGAQKVHVDFC